MTASLLQEKLMSGEETLETLELELGIKAKRHPSLSELVMLKYNQINSPMANPLVQEARGIIFDERDWSIVARPFDKFFNVQEPHAASLDWSTAEVQEKLDGSLMFLYHYAGDWRVASSGMPNAGGLVGDFSTTFATLFWRVWYDLGYSTDQLTPALTYVFELCTKANKVVVTHEKNRLVLLGARNPRTGREYTPLESLLNGGDFEIVRTYPLSNLAEIEASFADLDGIEHEGYVVRDACFRRVKVKHPRYLVYHRFLGAVTDKGLLDVVRRGERSEIVAYFPEVGARMDELAAKYKDLIETTVALYDSVRHIESQKEFALAIADSPHRAALFRLRAGKVQSFGEHYSSIPIDALAGMLGI